MAGSQSTAKRRMRGPERRAQLLAVARTVFGRSGFHRVSMDEVAKEAGVTKPILYDHFPSKKELYVALLEADLRELSENVRAALAGSPGNRERIRASFQAYFDFVDDHAEGFRLLMQEAVGAEIDFKDRVRRVRDDILEEVTELIERESRGQLSPGESRVVALGLIGMVETVAQEDPGRPRKERSEAVDTLVRLAWKGITGLTL
jgi:AcrR family transcriptional regulator